MATDSPMQPMRQVRHELLEDMVRQCSATLILMGIAPDVAEHCGCALADHFASHWGGQVVSIPKDHAHRLALRDLEIYNHFTGANHAQLAREYSLNPAGFRGGSTL